MTDSPSLELLAPAPASATARFDLTAEVDTLRSDPRLRDSGYHAKTLLRQEDLRIVLIVMRSGARLHKHQTDHGLTAQTLSGHVQLNVGSDAFDLPAGTMLRLGRGLVHDVVALQDSALLLSISWAGSR